MKRTKDCFAFGEKKICKVCGCKDGSCDCNFTEEKLKPAKANDDR